MGLRSSCRGHAVRWIDVKLVCHKRSSRLGGLGIPILLVSVIGRQDDGRKHWNVQHGCNGSYRGLSPSLSNRWCEAQPVDLIYDANPKTSECVAPGKALQLLEVI